MSDTTRPVLWAADTLSASTIVAVLLGYLPAAAAAIALIWYLIQIWESRTVQHYVQNRRMVRKAKRVARLKAKERVIAAQLEAMETIRQAKADARDKVEVAKVDAAKLQIKEENEAEQGD